MSGIRQFIEHHYSHFNARELKEAAQAYRAHLDAGGKMFVSMAGAMSTGQVGRILAPAIRQGLVHGVCCTGANLEEDAFRLIAGSQYESVPNWRTLGGAAEAELFDRHMNRVTDTSIPDSVIQTVEEQLIVRWQAAANSGRSAMPAEFILDVLRDPGIQSRFEEPEASWLLASQDMDVPIWTPGWEDSSSGNAFSAAVMRGDVSTHHCVEPGTAQMTRLVHWYMEHCDPAPGIGYFQIGGGIAGDFAICVVPLIIKELELADTPVWSYFCQISDAEVSFGGYSGAPPDEKITWGKLTADTPRFQIHSDASIVVPLILAYVMDMD